MRLANLLKDLEIITTVRGDIDVEVTGIAYDSREIKPGELFVCLPGLNTDGHLYISEAVEKGAVGIVVSKEVKVPEGVVRIKVQDSRKTLATLASRFFDDPTSKLTLIGVTGTNGKTTTAYLIESISRQAGKKTGLIGTVRYQIGARTLPVQGTTPESLDLQHIFNEMVKEKVEIAVIEASSHAIHQQRVEGCRFDVLVFTNLSQDHLDYHRDIEEYFRVKSSLFEKTDKEAYHIINQDDHYGRRILKSAVPPVLTYGLSSKAQVRAAEIEINKEGCSFLIETPGDSFSVHSQLRGKFNVYNSLAAAAVGVALGFSSYTIKKGLESLTNVPGRFEVIQLGQDFLVVVDYAHTPDGLEKVITAAKEIAHGRVITVFGCGGDRDKSKRPLMGKVAASLSDYAFITSDNPRSEKPEDIIDMIEEGFKQVKPAAAYVKITERRQAIFEAVSMARSGDLVLITGKGHEKGQIFADKVVPFDDREVATEAIWEKLACLR